MISKNNKYKTGYLVTAIFQISLHKRDEALLKAIKAYFGVGNLYLNRDGIEFKVQSIKDPPRITPPLAQAYTFIDGVLLRRGSALAGRILKLNSLLLTNLSVRQRKLLILT